MDWQKLIYSPNNSYRKPKIEKTTLKATSLHKNITPPNWSALDRCSKEQCIFGFHIMLYYLRINKLFIYLCNGRKEPLLASKEHLRLILTNILPHLTNGSLSYNASKSTYKYLRLNSRNRHAQFMSRVYFNTSQTLTMPDTCNAPRRNVHV